MIEIRRFGVSLIETACEALLLSFVMYLAFCLQQHSFGDKDESFGFGVLAFAIAAEYMFIVTGYVVSAGILRGFWNGKTPWSYSICAAVLFLIHSQILFRVAGTTIPARVLAEVAGIPIVLGCTNVGGRFLRARAW